MKQNDGPELNPGNATLTIPSGTGPTKFTVNIAGNPSIKFKAQDPLSVWAGPKTAPQPGIHSQILGPVITDKGDLVFFDLNMGDPVKLSYAIHFEGATTSVDPIIDNGGGGQPPPPPPPGGGYGFVDIGSSAFWMLMGAIFLASILGTLVSRLIKPGG